MKHASKDVLDEITVTIKRHFLVSIRVEGGLGRFKMTKIKSVVPLDKRKGN